MVNFYLILTGNMVQTIKRIKILFTIPNFDTAGSGKALLKVAKGLDALLFDAHICCMHTRGYFFKEVEKSGLPIHIVQYTTPMKPYGKGLWNCFKISKKLKAINPDIIHSFHYAPDYSEALAAKLAGVKWIYTKKNMNWGGNSKNGWKLRTFLASAVIAQNTDMIERFFKNTKHVYLVPRGVDTQEFVPTNPSEKLRNQWGLKNNNRVIICVANLVPVKGVEIVINAFSKIAHKHTDWVLMVVGDNQNKYGEVLKKLTKDLGLLNRIIFTGKQFNVNEYLNLSEVFVLPTLNKGRMEGSPVSLLEAMACKKNVLASNIPGIKDQLKEFPNHLIEAGNVEAWKTALEYVFLNTILENKNAGELLRKHVLNNYQIEKEIENCEKMYKKHN